MDIFVAFRVKIFFSRIPQHVLLKIYGIFKIQISKKITV